MSTENQQKVIISVEDRNGAEAHPSDTAKPQPGVLGNRRFCRFTGRATKDIHQNVLNTEEVVNELESHANERTLHGNRRFFPFKGGVSNYWEASGPFIYIEDFLGHMQIKRPDLPLVDDNRVVPQCFRTEARKLWMYEKLGISSKKEFHFQGVKL